MESIDFARKTAAAVLRTLELPEAAEIVTAPDDDLANRFCRQLIARAGLVEIDLVVTARVPNRWMSASVSATSDVRLWQYLVQAGPGESFQISCNFISEL